MSMYVLWMYVHHVKEHDVLLVLSHNHVAHVQELEWKQLKLDHSFYVLLVEHVMDDVKPSQNPVMNVQEKEERYRRNIQLYPFLPVRHTISRGFANENVCAFIVCRSGRWTNDAREFGCFGSVCHLSSQTK